MRKRFQFGNMSSKSKNGKELVDFNTPCRKYGDLYCEVCDAHTNTTEMWLAHIQGRRHIKNVEQGKFDVKYEDTGLISSIQQDIDELDEPVVGLDLVCELQRGEGASHFKCFLCSANNPTVETMIEHITSLKHKLAYMKQFSPKDFEQVQSTGLLKVHVKPIIEDICRDLQTEFGKGKVMIKKEKPKQTPPGISSNSNARKLCEEDEKESSSICVKKTNANTPMEGRQVSNSKDGFKTPSLKRPCGFEDKNTIKKSVVDHPSLLFEKDLRQQSNEDKSNSKWRPVGDAHSVKEFSPQEVSAQPANPIIRQKKNTAIRSSESVQTILKDLEYKEFIDIVYSVVESLTFNDKEELDKLEAIAHTLTGKLGVYHFCSLTEEQQSSFFGICQANNLNTADFLKGVQRSAGYPISYVFQKEANSDANDTPSYSSSQLNHIYQHSSDQPDRSICKLTSVDRPDFNAGAPIRSCEITNMPDLTFPSLHSLMSQGVRACLANYSYPSRNITPYTHY